MPSHAVRHVFLVSAIGISFVIGAGLQPSAIAQITPDSSLSTVVQSSDNLNFEIEGGSQSGRHLFHSFDDFSVPPDGAAQFNNSADITTIFSRVTGGNISEIHGELRTNHTATLFLMNPSGIMFGENASLNIGGSFFATTAERIIFADDAEFSAIQPSDDIPLLSINIAPGLQMGQQSGSIIVEGEGHSIIGGGQFPLIDMEPASGLTISSTQTLGLIAPAIHLSGGILSTSGGNIYLGGVSDGRLNLRSGQNHWRADSSAVSQFGDIDFSQHALVTTTGTTSGNIDLQGRNIQLDQGSLITVQHSGETVGGDIHIEATGRLSLRGSQTIVRAQDLLVDGLPGVATSRIMIDNLGPGTSGDIRIVSNDVFVADAGSIQSRSYGDGWSGDLMMDITDSIYVDGSQAQDPNLNSIVGSISFNDGNVGTMQVKAQHISILDGAVMGSATFGEGRGGDLDVQTEDLIIAGFAPIGVSPSTLSSSTFGPGNSGVITLDVTRLSVQNGGIVSTSTLNQGDAGALTVNASEWIRVSGAVPELGLVSGLLSDAPIVDQSLQQRLGLPARPTGNSGSVWIRTPQLTIEHGGVIAASNRGAGDSGQLRIEANEVALNEAGAITVSSQFGQGGDITIDAARLLTLRNDSVITAEIGKLVDNLAFLEGDRSASLILEQLSEPTNGNGGTITGGNITLSAPFVVGLANSDISANAFEGDGGNININTQSLLGLQFRDRLTPNSDITASSEFGLDGTVEISAFKTDLEPGLVELPSELVDISDRVALGCSNVGQNRFTVTGRGGTPTEPGSDRPWLQLWPDFGPIPDERSALSALSIEWERPSTLHQDEHTAVTPPPLYSNPFREATRMAIAPNGTLQLIASSAQAASLPEASCPSQPNIL